MIQKVSIKLKDDELVLETGRVARQANGAVYARYGGSVVIATVCASRENIEGIDYVPLSVEYNEKYYAAGKIPGGFLKREGRPKDKEIIVSRLIDRPMRPLFPKKIRRDIQVVPTTISTDQSNPPDIIAMIASSAAVTISDIPFAGPIGAVRIGYSDNQFIVNPTFEQIEQCELDIVVAGTDQGITMVEGGAKEVAEDIMLQAIEEAHKIIKQICALQRELAEKAGREKFELEIPEEDPLACKDELWSWAFPKMEQACFVAGKQKRVEAMQAVFKEAKELFKDKIEETQEKTVYELFEEMETHIVRSSVLKHKKRTDGRGPQDIRPISCEVDVLPRTHGSALFTRGETQSLTVATLGTVFDEQIMDDIEGDTRKSFLLHYNFPPFSVGETGRMGTGRREIGHGHLAERALRALLPSRDEFPYTLRIVSEILESNGSSSMATVCAGSLALFNAGVPIKKQIAGIAMGLITEDSDYVVLSDILGEEDHLGDMDFKVAGTADGITAFQMDIKIAGIDPAIMKTALEQAKAGRLHILNIMNQTISEPRGEISEYAPKIINIMIDVDKIGAVIGPGGKMIKSITEETGATINIENDGKVSIYCKDKEGAECALKAINEIVEDPEVGKIYTGTVKRIMDFGAFIEILPGKEGLCHISRLSPTHVKSVSDVVKEGQEVKVKVIEIDSQGRINLCHIDALGTESARPGKTRDNRRRKPSSSRYRDNKRDRRREY
jgi:polyribonucleotide nucleotidyltransferase